MLPAFLGDSYKRYKDDTSTFIRWLVENARSCGYNFNESTANSSPEAAKAGGRLKGKARKLSKQGTGTGSTSNSKPPADKQKTYVVDSSELVNLAHTISNSKKTLITMPPEIVRAGMRAVSARKKCTAYFESITKDDSDDEKVRGNESHAYFTKLMEDVLRILQPHFTSFTTPNNTNEQTSGSLLQDLQNRFAQLELEEPEEIDDETIVEAPISNQLAVYELKATDQNAVAEEKAFAYYCLFSDLEKLRSHLKAVWTDYKAERTDIITAAVVTNTAFQLAMRAQDEALSAFPGAGDYAEFMFMTLQAHGDEEFSMDEETTDWMLYFAFQKLHEFCRILHPPRIPLMKRGYFGVYNPLDDRSQMEWKEKHSEDEILLLELLPEFCFMRDSKDEHFAADELTKALAQMTLTKEIPIWLVFATTVFMDIHHVMREKAERAFDDFQAIVKIAKRAMESHTDFMRNVTCPKSWPAQNDLIARRFIWDMENTMLGDPTIAGKIEVYAESRVSISEEYERFYLYKRQPILCGLLAFRTTLMLKELGIAHCNAFGTGVFPAHLYNALQQKPSWPDMDKLIDLHTPERVFLGGRPTTTDNCFKQACLMLGHSVADFAVNQRRGPKRVVVSKNGPRGLEEVTPLCAFFRQGLCEQKPMAIVVHDIEELLNKQAQEEALKQNPKSKILRHEWSRYGRLTPTQLLEALRTSLAIELPKLSFNYFDLHRQSIEMLRKVNAELKKDLTRIVGAQYIENESQLPTVGLWILKVASQTEKVAENIGLGGATSGLLEKAGKAFEDFLDERRVVAGWHSTNSIG
jgi:hypothetical protein